MPRIALVLSALLFLSACANTVANAERGGPTAADAGEAADTVTDAAN